METRQTCKTVNRACVKINLMDKVKQVLIAAGGRGTRLSPETNPNGSKVLIEYNGKTLLEYLIDSLIAGGIKEFIISTGYHTDKAVREIRKRKKIAALVLPVSECGSFRMIPYYLQDLLDERFLFVCGHQPLSPKFVEEMLDASMNSKYVASAYKGNLYKLERAKNMRILYNSVNGKIEIDSKNFNPKKLSSKTFIDSPYILTKDVVFEFANNKKGEYSSYIFNRCTNGESLTVMESPTPPEFDYDEEFEITIKSLRGERRPRT